jgi:hypothetical protein
LAHARRFAEDLKILRWIAAKVERALPSDFEAGGSLAEDAAALEVPRTKVTAAEAAATKAVRLVPKAREDEVRLVLQPVGELARAAIVAAEALELQAAGWPVFSDSSTPLVVAAIRNALVRVAVIADRRFEELRDEHELADAAPMIREAIRADAARVVASERCSALQRRRDAKNAKIGHLADLASAVHGKVGGAATAARAISAGQAATSSAGTAGAPRRAGGTKYKAKNKVKDKDKAARDRKDKDKATRDRKDKDKDKVKDERDNKDKDEAKDKGKDKAEANDKGNDKGGAGTKVEDKGKAGAKVEDKDKAKIVGTRTAAGARAPARRQ